MINIIFIIYISVKVFMLVQMCQTSS